jgi:prevent-host-death family protein
MEIIMSSAAEAEAGVARYPEVSVSDARAGIAHLVDRVGEMGERHVITRHGHPVAVVIPVADLATLEAADREARAALSWPEASVGEIEAEEAPLGGPPRGEPEDAVLGAEIEHLVRQATHALIHNPELQDLVARVLDSAKAARDGGRDAPSNGGKRAA